MSEFLSSGRQDVYNTRETEILSAKISRLGLEEDLKSSPFTKYKIGIILYLSHHRETKDTKPVSYKKQ